MRLAAPVLCRTCRLGAYLHGLVAQGKHSSLLSCNAKPQQLRCIPCLRAHTWKAFVRRGKVCEIPSLPCGPACPAPAARRVLHLALGRPPSMPHSILLLPWQLQSAPELMVAPHHLGSGVHAALLGCRQGGSVLPVLAAMLWHGEMPGLPKRRQQSPAKSSPALGMAFAPSSWS